jgi:Domain of unknown function (DU1801)
MDADASVTAYLDEVAEPDRSTLVAWRELCLGLPDPFCEGIRYGMPSYSRSGAVEIAFARQKRYLSLYVLRTDVVSAHRDRLVGYSPGKGCIRFPLSKPTDLDLVASLVAGTGATGGPVCFTGPGRGVSHPSASVAS